MSYTSETEKHREKFIAHLPPSNLLDIGCGGAPIVPWAVACDWTAGCVANAGDAPIQLDFDCRKMPFKDGTISFCYASHVLEDFSYRDQVAVLSEWKRCLVRGGGIGLLLPDQQRYLAHCRATGQDINLAHKESDMSLATFRSRVWPQIAGDMSWVEGRDLEDYSFYVILKKL